MKKPLALIIMDGFGCAKESYGNAIVAARTPNLDRLFTKYPNTTIEASGMSVGLPDGQMGNSEVGHTNLGAGRVVYQQLTCITKSIMDGDFFKNPALVGAVQNCLDNKSALHLCGLVSDGGVHSHNTHLYALVELAKRMGLEKVYVHAFTDGRDVPPTSAAEYIAQLRGELKKIGAGRIATVSGRYYAMDRDNRWERVQKVYDAMALGEGPYDPDPVHLVEQTYAAGLTDEFIVPTVVTSDARVSANDSVIFFNFRPDRARQLTRAFVDPDFSGFPRAGGFFPLYYVCMTQYDAAMPNVHVAFHSDEHNTTFGEYISSHGLTQLRIAETEKYAHVTFFFNGGVETPFPGEDRVLIPSPKVATYDLQPEMNAAEVTEEAVRRLESGKYDVMILNFANCDMVGHTGVYDAAVKAVEAVDTGVGKVVDTVLALGGRAVITADHGNAEKMYEPDGSPFTAHTCNPVPVAVVGAGDMKLRSGGKLADVAPTLLDLLGLPLPASMSGQSLLVR